MNSFTASLHCGTWVRQRRPWVRHDLELPAKERVAVHETVMRKILAARQGSGEAVIRHIAGNDETNCVSSCLGDLEASRGGTLPLEENLPLRFRLGVSSSVPPGRSGTTECIEVFEADPCDAPAPSSLLEA